MTTEDRQYFDSLTERVLNAIFEVSNTLGAGFPEKVYERALPKELSLRNIEAISQASFPVTKCVECLAAQHSAQCLNYLHVWQKPLPLGQFSKANGRMEACSPRFPALGFTLPAIRFHSERSELTRYSSTRNTFDF